MLHVKDDVCARQCRPFFSPALQCQLLCMRQYCRPGIGWMRCSMIFCAPCGATRCTTWQPRLSYSHESDDDDIEERYLAAKGVEHECSWLSMQLWKTSTEYMPIKARHSHSGKYHGKYHGYDTNCAGFFPKISSNHKNQKHTGVANIHKVNSVSCHAKRR